MYRKYSEDIPSFFHNRPKKLIKVAMEKMKILQEEEHPEITKKNDSMFTVKSSVSTIITS